MQRISLSGSAVWPPLTWPTTSVSASSTTSAPIRPEPGIEGPPVWMVDWMPYLRAQATICFAFAPSLTPPRPTSPRSFTPASASSLKSCSVMPGSITGAPACSLTPLTRKLLNARCAKMACAFRPTMSRGRPGLMHLPGRDHRGDAAVQRRVDPAELVLARSPVARDRVDVAVDEARRDHGSLRVHDCRRAFRVHVLRPSDRNDAPVHRDDRIGVEDRIFDRPREQKADVADHRLAGAAGRGRVMSHENPPCVRRPSFSAGAFIPPDRRRARRDAPQAPRSFPCTARRRARESPRRPRSFARNAGSAPRREGSCLRA